MPFAIRKQGNRVKVIEALKSIVENDAEGKPVKDQRLIEVAKSAALVLSEIPDSKLEGALVIIDGRADANKVELSIQIVGQEGHY